MDKSKEKIAQIVDMVVITAQNPSLTLDNKSHDDSSPILKLVGEIFPSLVNKEQVSKKMLLSLLSNKPI